jgi:N-acetylated-alpha-linked acidic dipeptidase
VSGSHTLERFINDVAREVEDPEAKISVWKRAHARAIADASSAEERREIRQRPDLRLAALGSGSDYTAFIDHLGVASLNLGFGGEDGGGIYHSIYDDLYWYTRFSDRELAYGRALAQTVGLAVLRLADAELLPFEFEGFADTMRAYLKDLKALLERKQEEIAERNRQIEEGVFEATLDPRRPTVAPRREDVPPHLNFAPIENAVAALQQSAGRFTRARARVEQQTVAPEVLARVNAMLARSERLLLSPEGLPRRPWFKHLLYAPGVYAGYGAKTMPGAREAIELMRYSEANGEIARIARALEDVAALADRAAVELEERRSP